jgi:hypothetical protein
MDKQTMVNVLRLAEEREARLSGTPETMEHWLWAETLHNWPEHTQVRGFRSLPGDPAGSLHHLQISADMETHQPDGIQLRVKEAILFTVRQLSTQPPRIRVVGRCRSLPQAEAYFSGLWSRMLDSFGGQETAPSHLVSSGEQGQTSIPHQLVRITQSACLLSATMIQGRQLPDWFLAQAPLSGVAKHGQPTSNEGADEAVGERGLAQWTELVTPLSRSLLKMRSALEACWQEIRFLSITEDERIWLLGKMRTLIQSAYNVASVVERKENAFRILDLLIRLVLRAGSMLIKILFQRVDPETLDRLKRAQQEVRALYHAIERSSQEERQLLASELGSIIPALTGIERELRENLPSR